MSSIRSSREAIEPLARIASEEAEESTRRVSAKGSTMDGGKEKGGRNSIDIDAGGDPLPVSSTDAATRAARKSSEQVAAVEEDAYNITYEMYQDIVVLVSKYLKMPHPVVPEAIRLASAKRREALELQRQWDEKISDERFMHQPVGERPLSSFLSVCPCVCVCQPI